MKRILLGAAVLACSLGTAASTASARIVELGASPDAVTASCPDDCFVVTRTTALQVRTGDQRYPTTAPSNGRVVAFTLQLGQLTARQIERLDQTYGGSSRVQLTVLREKPRRTFQVVAQTGTFRIQPYFGSTVQFPLKTTLPVRRGDVIALTVSTWAPVLAVNLARENGWRASRADRCGDDTTLVMQTAQQVVGNETQYKCLYQTARLTYTATLIENPVAPRTETRRDTKTTTRDSTRR